MKERCSDALVARLDLADRVRLLAGADFWSTAAMPAIGLRRMVWSDGGAGVRGERWDERAPSVSLPAPVCQGATWDPELLEQVGEALAVEAIRHGVDVVNAPTVNLQRTPYAGRHFEYLGEDPLLVADLAAAVVRGLQRSGVGACVKHFVANDAETERLTVDVLVDDRALQEVYLRPFHRVVQEGVWAVMAAYNRLGGTPMTEHPLLSTLLREQWGFDGVVVSDWGAATSTVGTARAGLDLTMPGPEGVWGDRLLAAVRAGEVPEELVDEKATHLLGLAERVGALRGRSAVLPPQVQPADVAFDVAAAGMVLLRNEGVLPLRVGAIRRLAVIGSAAAWPSTQGGGSTTVVTSEGTSLLEELERVLGPEVEVTFAEGASSATRWRDVGSLECVEPEAGGCGMRVRIYDASGHVLREERRFSGQLVWLRGSLPKGAAQLEVETALRMPSPGEWTFAVGGGVRRRLSVAGKLVLDASAGPPAAANDPTHFLHPPLDTADIAIDDGELRPVRASFDLGDGTDEVVCRFAFACRWLGDAEELELAVLAAHSADVAIVVVGTDAAAETEGRDRVSLGLSTRQDAMIGAVATANPRTVVVVNSGGPVLLPWRERVGAVLAEWFPGQAGGAALASILLGEREPRGRLPFTWPTDERPELIPEPVNGRLEYREGIGIGYRGALGDGTVAYPFGHGLGYTDWQWTSLTAHVADPGAEAPNLFDAAFRATAELTNVGDRAGTQVVQLYARRPDSRIARPSRWLVGHALVRAEAGAAATAEIDIPWREFAHWDGGWALEPGVFELLAGPSCAVLPLHEQVDVSISHIAVPVSRPSGYPEEP